MRLLIIAGTRGFWLVQERQIHFLEINKLVVGIAARFRALEHPPADGLAPPDGPDASNDDGNFQHGTGSLCTHGIVPACAPGWLSGLVPSRTKLFYRNGA